MIQRGNETEQHRRECEARQVMRMPGNERQAHYEAIGKIRGQMARSNLIDEVNKQYKIQQQKIENDRNRKNGLSL
ncbi:MAG: hypothetical protein ABI216_22010 [Devosia sp.]